MLGERRYLGVKFIGAFPNKPSGLNKILDEEKNVGKFREFVDKLCFVHHCCAFPWHFCHFPQPPLLQPSDSCKQFVQAPAIQLNFRVEETFTARRS